MPGAMRPQYTYDGWSGVPRLKNNEPPLLQLYSNPKKAKLTVEVGPGSGFGLISDLCVWCIVTLRVWGLQTSLGLEAAAVNQACCYVSCHAVHRIMCMCHRAHAISLQGFQMAAALHADAVGRGTVQPLPPHAAPPPPYHLAAVAAIAAEGGAGAAQPAALAVATAAQQVASHMCIHRVHASNRL